MLNMANVYFRVRLTSFLLVCVYRGAFCFRLDLEASVEQARLGTDVYLRCSVFSLRQNFFTEGGAISFHRKDVEVAKFSTSSEYTNYARYRFRGYELSNKYVVTLYIDGFREEDSSDMYQCGTIESGSWVSGSKSCRLRLLKNATTGYPTCELKITNGDQARLKCSSSTGTNPPPTLVWQREDIDLSTKTFEALTNEFTTNATNMDRPYVCRYSYTDGVFNDQRSCWIGKPIITMISEISRSYTAGDDVRITVLVRAHPQITSPVHCTWNYRDTGSIQIQSQDYASNTITISDVQPSMNGSRIDCSGRNMVGETTKTFTLFVNDVVETVVNFAYIITNKISIDEGDSVTFKCINDFNPMMHHVSVAWRISENSKQRFNETTEKNQLVLKAASMKENGTQISCRVSFDEKTIISDTMTVSVRPLSSATIRICPSTDVNQTTDTLISYLKKGTADVLVICFLCLIGAIVCLFIVCKAVYLVFNCRKSNRQLKSTGHFGESMRTTSFTYLGDSETPSECPMFRVNIPDSSGLLKRSVSLPSSRCLPSVPPCVPLPSIHEYQDAPRAATYSIIGPDDKEVPRNPDEHILQPYMDMRGKNEDEMLTNSNKTQLRYESSGVYCSANDTVRGRGNESPTTFDTVY